MNQISRASEFTQAQERSARWNDPAVSSVQKAGLDQLSHIPGRKGLPIMGVLPEAVMDPIGFARRMHARFGPVYRFYALGSWNVQLIGPEANELVLFDRDSIFSAYGGWSPVIEPFFPGALLIQDGERHRASRRLLGEAFRQQKLSGYQRIFDRDIESAVSSWIGREIDVYEEVKRLTMQVAASTFLGIDIGQRANEAMGAFANLMGALLALGRSRWLSPVAARGYKGRAYLEQLIGELIREKRAAPGDDILSRVCTIGEEEGEALSDQEIKDAIIFLLAAAHDTLASAFTSVIYFLGRERGWPERLREEIELSGIDEPIEAGLASLPLQDICFKEALRLNAPAPVIWRRSTRPYSLYGFDLPAGTITGVSPMLVHLDPAIWPDPTHFNPYRFTPEAEATRHKHAFVPFGGGVHKCLGLHFAQQQARIFMTHLVTKTDISVPDAATVRWYHWPNCRPRGRLNALISARPRQN